MILVTCKIIMCSPLVIKHNVLTIDGVRPHEVVVVLEEPIEHGGPSGGRVDRVTTWQPVSTRSGRAARKNTTLVTTCKKFSLSMLV